MKLKRIIAVIIAVMIFTVQFTGICAETDTSVQESPTVSNASEAEDAGLNNEEDTKSQNDDKNDESENGGQDNKDVQKDDNSSGDKSTSDKNESNAADADKNSLKNNPKAKIAFELFTPEDGIVATKKDLSEACYRNLKLCERLEFSGKYTENKESRNTDYGIYTFPSDGDLVKGKIEHYVRHYFEHFYVVTLSFADKNYVCWRYDSPDRDIMSNGISFFFSRILEDGAAYELSSNWQNSSNGVHFRGAVKNKELTEVWLEFEERSLVRGSVICDFDYTFDYKSIENNIVGKTQGRMLELFSCENGSVNDKKGVADPKKTEEEKEKNIEESVEKFGSYENENGEHIKRRYFSGSRKINGVDVYYKCKLNDKIEFVVQGNFDGVSSDSNTKFTIYQISTTQSEEGESDKRHSFDILELSGNLGKALYVDGSVVWKAPGELKISGYDDLDDKNMIMGWAKITKTANNYFEYGNEDDSDITVHYNNKERTYIDYMDFSFCGQSKRVDFNNIDYIGSFLNYFVLNIGITGSDEFAEKLGFENVKK